MIFYYFFLLLFSFIGIVLHSVIDWYNEVFGVSFKEILYTIASPLKGADISFLMDAVYEVYPFVFLWATIIIAFVFFDIKIIKSLFAKKIFRLLVLAFFYFCVLILFYILIDP